MNPTFTRRTQLITFRLASALAAAAPLSAPAAVPGRTLLPDNMGRQAASVVRDELSAAEAAAPLQFEIALRVRNYGELQARVARGEQIPYAELEEKYLPTEADYDRIVAWARSQGLAVTRNDRHRLGVFATGSIAQIQSALGTHFARVRRQGVELTSAVTPPQLPSEWASAVLSVSGLQPQPPQAGPLSVFVGGDTYLAPSDLAGLYGSASTGLNGTGQTIAIIMDSAPYSDDLTAFWTDCQVPQSLSNLTVIPVNGGAPSNGHQFEASLDVEWTSGMAPSAKIRLYTIPDITTLASLDAALAQIIQDLPGNPGLHQLSISIGLPELGFSFSQLQSSSQYFTVLASQGVTTFAGSGDGGSNPGYPDPVYYNPNDPVEVSYPGSDPSVIGVGGSYLVFSNSNTFVSETAWGINPSTTYPDGHGFDATGGGYSVFPRPAWQAGLNPPGPAGTGRCVPDVCAPAISSPYGLVLYGHGQPLGVIGTSWSTPVWAAFCALLNQARAAASEPPLGLLGPKIYELPQSPNFRAITGGSNGAYPASAPYNLCTGLGVPNVATLLKSLVQGPTVTTAPAAATVAVGGTLSLSVAAAGSGPLSYQWNYNGAQIAGATGASYSVSNLAANQGGAYSVTVSNTFGSVTSIAAQVTPQINARLVNLSTRAFVGTGADVLETGFVVGGAGQKQLVLRAVGPTLSRYGVTGTLPAPQLTLYNASQTQIASNTVWGGGAALSNAFNQVGAFSLPANSTDSALLAAVAPAAYTAQVNGVGGATGIALAEVYDADTGTPTARLVNLSSRGFVGGGASLMDAGFAIGGTSSDTVLIRAVGPTLSQYGVSGPLASPQLSVFDSKGNRMAFNAAWGGGSVLSSVFNQVGAFPLPANSNDCAVLLTLPPGTYTAEVAGAGSATGPALVEIYEVP